MGKKGWGGHERHDKGSGSGSGGTRGSGGAKASATKSYHNGGVEGDGFAAWYDEHLSVRFSGSGSGGTRGSGSGGTKGSGSGGTKGSGSGGTKGSGSGGTKGSGSGGTRGSGSGGTRGSGSGGTKGSGSGGTKGSGSGGTKGSGSGGTKGTPETYRESFEWNLAPDPNDTGPIDNHDDLSRGFTQNTGHVDVTFSVLGASAGAISEFYTSSQYTDGIATDGTPADANSAMSSFLSSPTGEGDFASYELAFSSAVTNVSFRINDIDTDALARVQAFDADGNQIAVSLTAGSGIVMSDSDSVAGNDLADSVIGDVPSSAPEASMLVEITGPVSRIVIDHAQDGPAPTGIDVTDVYFDVTVDADAGGTCGQGASATDSYHNGGVEGPAFAQWYDANLARQYEQTDTPDDAQGSGSGGAQGSGSGGTKGSGSGGTKGGGSSGTKGSGSGGTKGGDCDDGKSLAADELPAFSGDPEGGGQVTGPDNASLTGGAGGTEDGGPPIPSLEDIMSLMTLVPDDNDPSLLDPEVEDVPDLIL